MEDLYAKLVSVDGRSANLDTLLLIFSELRSKYGKLMAKQSKNGNFSDATFYEGSLYAIAALEEDIRRRMVIVWQERN